MTTKIIFKKGEETMLDTLMLNCGYHINCCNNGYSCTNKDNTEGIHNEDCPNKDSGCFAFACPLAYQKNPDEDEENGRYGDETLMVLTQDILEHELGQFNAGEKNG